MGVSSRHLAQLVVNSKQKIHQVSAWEIIQKFGRPPPWPITSRRSRSSLIQFPDAPTSAESLDTRSTAVDSPPLPDLRLLLPKLLEHTPRKEKSSGSTSVRNQMCMSMVSPSALVHQTRLENMLSLEMSLVTLQRLMRKSLSRLLKAEFPGLVHMRIPVCNSAAPLETDFDILV